MTSNLTTSDIHADGFEDPIDFSHQDALDRLLTMLDDASSSLPLPITPGVYADREGTEYIVVYIVPSASCLFPVIGFDADDNNCDITISWAHDGRYYNSPDAHQFDLVKRIGDLP